MSGHLFPHEPAMNWSVDDLNKLLLWATELGMSDLLVRSNSPAWMRLHGHWQRVTEKKLVSNDLFNILNAISSNQAASAALRSKGADLDFGYEISKSRTERLRYRGNATAIAEGYSVGVRIVLRAIPSEPPALKNFDIEPEILQNAFPVNGLVLVTGVMGSGKSTLLFSLLREIVEQGGRHVITYESPIEFDLDAIPDKRGPVSQSQVPQHLESFLAGTRNSTRIAPDVVLIGESRDTETLRGMIESAEIGVAAYSTVHTRNVPETLSRIINVFEVQERSQVTSTLISSLRLIIQQRLVPKVDGGRIALREFLPFTSEVREKLLVCPPDKLIQEAENQLFERGQPLQEVAHRLYSEGKIARTDYLSIMSERDNYKPLTKE